jgi:hypothetical protein
MFPRLTAFAFACLVSTGASAADELLPGNGYSIHLPGFEGVVYYTVEQTDYKVVTTLASGAEGSPVRLSSTLRPGQRIVISVPQSDGLPSVDIEILRDGDAVIVSDPAAAVSAPTVGLSGEAPMSAAVRASAIGH